MSEFSLSLRATVSALIFSALCSGFAAAQSPAANRGIAPESFKARFYNSADLAGGVFLELLPYPRTIDFHLECFGESWPFQGCELIPQLADGSDYSVSWSGRLFAPADGDYVFSLTDVDDGARLFLDNVEIVDQGWRWPDPDRRPSPQRVRLTAGWHELQVDYEQRIFAAASLEVRWAGPGFVSEVIPFVQSTAADALSPRGGVSVLSLRPTFTWKDTAAQRYILNIYHIRGSPPNLEQRRPPVILSRTQANCAGGLCSFKPGFPSRRDDLNRFELSTLLAPPDDPKHQPPELDESFIGYAWQVRAVVDDKFVDGIPGQFQIPKLGRWDGSTGGSTAYRGGYWNLFDDSFYRWGEVFDVPPAVLKAIAYGESATRLAPRQVETEFFPPTRAYLYEPARNHFNLEECSGECFDFRIDAYTADPAPYDRNVVGKPTIKQFVKQVGFSNLSRLTGFDSIPGCDPEDPDPDLCDTNTSRPAEYGTFASYGLGQVLFYSAWPTLRNIALGELPPPVKLYEPDFTIRAMASVLGMDKRCRALTPEPAPEYPNASAPFERWASSVGKYNGGGKSYSDLVKSRLSLTQPDTPFGVQWELGQSGSMEELVWKLVHLVDDKGRPTPCETNLKSFQDEVKGYLTGIGVPAVTAVVASASDSGGRELMATPAAAVAAESLPGTEVSSVAADLKGDGSPVFVTLWIVGFPDLGKAGVIRIFEDDSRQTLLWESPPVATNVLDTAAAVAVFNPAIGRVVVLSEWFEGFHSSRTYLVRWDGDQFALVPVLDQDGGELDGVFSDYGGVYVFHDGSLLAHRQNYLTHLQRIVDVYRFDGVAYRAERSFLVDEEALDTTPPHTTASLSPVLAASGWNRVATTLRLAAVDDQEVQSINYLLANGTGSVRRIEPRGSVEVGLGEGRWRVTFHATDVSGNREADKELAVRIDFRPPRTKASLEGKPAGEGKFRGPVQVTLRARDRLLQDTSPGSGVARIEYSLDNGAHWKLYARPFSITTAGSTVVTYRSTDVAGNVESPKTVTVVIKQPLPKRDRIACLDAGYDPTSGLSKYVVQVNKRVIHVSQCRDDDRVDRRDDERDEDDARDRHRSRDERCGLCGASGFYRLRPGGLLVLRTPELPADGRYRVQLQARAAEGEGRLTLHVGAQRFDVEVKGTSWRWTAPVALRLEEGSNLIRVQSAGDEPVDIEALRIE